MTAPARSAASAMRRTSYAFEAVMKLREKPSETKTTSLRSGMGAAVRMRLSSEASVLSVVWFACIAME
jgi:hypothetical protein